LLTQVFYQKTANRSKRGADKNITVHHCRTTMPNSASASRVSKLTLALLSFLTIQQFNILLNIKSPAIVLRLVRHSDKASVLHLYTRDCGRVQYMVYGIDSKRKTAQRTILSPLFEIEIEAEHRESRTIQQLREFQLSYVPVALQTDVRRQCVAMFIAEILSSSLLHPLREELLYSFLHETLVEVDTCPDPENAHLRFLLGFAELQGFGVDYELPDNRLFAQILTLSATERISRGERQTILSALLRYYETHLPDFQTPKSVDILQELFD